MSIYCQHIYRFLHVYAIISLQSPWKRWNYPPSSVTFTLSVHTVFIQRPLSIPHILRECANKSHQQNLTYHVLKLPVLALPGDPGLVIRSHIFFRKKMAKTYQHLIWWTYARFTMKKSILGLWNQERLRSHSRLIPPGFPNCQLLFLSFITKDFHLTRIYKRASNTIVLKPGGAVSNSIWDITSWNKQ